jgi:CheY-like chemotaxis protein
MKILMADDDRISRVLMQRILEADGGHTLTMVNDGEEAWQKLLASPEPFDVCLFDIMMPRLDGLALITLMRSDNRFVSTPVILCTSINDRTTVRKAALLSVTQYIVKPYTRENVLGKIHQIQNNVADPRSIEDSATVCTRLGVDAATYRTLLEGIVQEACESMERLQTVRSPTDKQALLGQINGLKGSALSLGARALATQLRALEETLERIEVRDRLALSASEKIIVAVTFHEVAILRKHLQRLPPV